MQFTLVTIIILFLVINFYHRLLIVLGNNRRPSTFVMLIELVMIDFESFGDGCVKVGVQCEHKSRSCDLRWLEYKESGLLDHEATKINGRSINQI